MLNYLALLGWSLADDRDVFSMSEMVAAFDISKVNSNPARFDQKKADALNAEHIRLLEPGDFAHRLRQFLTEHGHIGADVDEKVFAAAAELVQTRIVVLGDAWDLLRFLFAPADEFTVDEAAAAKNLGADAVPVLEAAIATTQGLRAGAGGGHRLAHQPAAVRVAGAARARAHPGAAALRARVGAAVVESGPKQGLDQAICSLPAEVW
ncbi:glutamyl-tRNA synthetase [Mycobacteroides abscessus subsp. abscessus]|nr:glutamyl-tRNA synthetase [Mycobacteroides abscessus subsp. abscessus]